MKGYFIALTVIVVGVCCMLISMQGSINQMVATGGGGGGGLNSSAPSYGTGATGQRETDSASSGTGFVQDSLTFGTGSMFDYLALLDHVQRTGGTGPLQKYYQNLIEIYTQQWNNQFNDYKTPATPSFLAGMHYKETSWGNYIADHIGTTYGSGQVATLQTQDEDMVAAFLPNYRSIGSSSGNVWKDNGGTGYPDGPFQIEEAKPKISGWETMVAKNSNKPDQFDTYSFRDQMNRPSERYDKSMTRFSELGLTMSTTLKDMFAAGVHNRGSWNTQAWGIAYVVSGSNNASNYLISMAKDDAKLAEEELYPFRVIEDAFLKYGLPFTDSYFDGSNSTALCYVIFMKDGWFLEETPKSRLTTGLRHYYDKPDGENPIVKIFPEWTTYEKALEEIEAKYVKTLSESLGLSAAEVDKRYNTINGMYIEKLIPSNNNDRGSYTFMYKNEGTPGYNYKDSTTTHVRLIDGVGADYWLGVGIMGEALLVKLALEAGASTELDGKIVDPTNPKMFYTSTNNTYDPMSGGNADKLKFIMNLLGEQTNDLQFAALLEAYNDTGLPYVYGGQGKYGDDYIPEHGKKGPEQREAYYISGKDYAGRRMYDCTAFGSIIWGGSVEGYKFIGGSSAWVDSVNKTRDITVAGRSIDGMLKFVDGSGNISESSPSQNATDWSGVARPADVLARTGHVIIWLGTNRTSETVVIPTEYTGAGLGAVTVKPGQGVILNNGGGGDETQKSRVQLSYSDDGYKCYRIKGLD